MFPKIATNYFYSHQKQLIDHLYFADYFAIFQQFIRSVLKKIAAIGHPDYEFVIFFLRWAKWCLSLCFFFFFGNQVVFYRRPHFLWGLLRSVIAVECHLAGKLLRVGIQNKTCVVFNQNFYLIYCYFLSNYHRCLSISNFYQF